MKMSKIFNVIMAILVLLHAVKSIPIESQVSHMGDKGDVNQHNVSGGKIQIAHMGKDSAANQENNEGSTNSQQLIIALNGFFGTQDNARGAGQNNQIIRTMDDAIILQRNHGPGEGSQVIKCEKNCKIRQVNKK